jgi:hypothetical protein
MGNEDLWAVALTEGPRRGSPEASPFLGLRPMVGLRRPQSVGEGRHRHEVPREDDFNRRE